MGGRPQTMMSVLLGSEKALYHDCKQTAAKPYGVVKRVRNKARAEVGNA